MKDKVDPYDPVQRRLIDKEGLKSQESILRLVQSVFAVNMTAQDQRKSLTFCLSGANTAFDMIFF